MATRSRPHADYDPSEPATYAVRGRRGWVAVQWVPQEYKGFGADYGYCDGPTNPEDGPNSWSRWEGHYPEPIYAACRSRYARAYRSFAALAAECFAEGEIRRLLPER